LPVALHSSALGLAKGLTRDGLPAWENVPSRVFVSKFLVRTGPIVRHVAAAGELVAVVNQAPRRSERLGRRFCTGCLKGIAERGFRIAR
jgi:hypothetical protein